MSPFAKLRASVAGRRAKPGAGDSAAALRRSYHHSDYPARKIDPGRHIGFEDRFYVSEMSPEIEVKTESNFKYRIPRLAEYPDAWSRADSQAIYSDRRTRRKRSSSIFCCSASAPGKHNQSSSIISNSSFLLTGCCPSPDLFICSS